MQKVVFILSSLLLAAAFAGAQSYTAQKFQPKIKTKPSVQPKAYFFFLEDVQLTDNLFRPAQELNLQYLLRLKPDRFLHRFHLHAGLPVKDSIYGGWESKDVSGFNLGHYLSACALMYANTKNAEIRKRIDYIVEQLSLCQQKRGTGYVGAIPGEDSVFSKIKQGIVETQGADLNGVWVPWYVVHKLMAGLADAYIYGENVKAKTVLLKLADWTFDVVKNLSETQQAKMLLVEFGGMPDILVHCYELTADKKYLQAAAKFYDKRILQALVEGRNELYQKHANTQFPKILAQGRLYNYTASSTDSTIASFFWNEVVHKHSYVIGGNSNHENFSRPNVLSNELTEKTTETCNTYNMLRLTKQLYSRTPDAAYFDFYERSLYSHIMATHHPQTGMYCYYAPLKTGAVKNWSTPFNDFWCCVGTGMESHSKHAEQIYACNNSTLFVNLFVSSTLNWKDKNIRIVQQSGVPENGVIKLQVKGKAKFKLAIRIPKWTSVDWNITIAGKKYTDPNLRGKYFEMEKVWNNEEVFIHFPMALYYESMPDNAKRVAILYGPNVLAGVLNDGKKQILTGSSMNAMYWVEKKQGLQFMAMETKPDKIKLMPYNQITNEKLQVYFDYYSNDDYSIYKKEMEERERQEELIEAATIDEVRIGEQQPEQDHNLKGQHTKTGSAHGGRWRDATSDGWFSYELTIAKAAPKYKLLVTYWGGDANNREFDILIDGTLTATVILNAAKPNEFMELTYAIPSQITANKKTITVKFQAKPGKVAGGVYGLRLLKAD
jgi:uncharacterized protein